MNHQKRNITKGLRACVIGACLLTVSLCGCNNRTEDFIEENEQQEDILRETPTPEVSLPPEKIYVYVCGEVEKPGVVLLESGSRVFQAIEKAGGCTLDAAVNYINQAESLEDGQQIYVPSVQEVEEKETIPLPAGEASFDGGTTENGKVNLNTAMEEELTTLTGIGLTRAQAIISYREENGSFSAIEEIMNVQGIKEGTFEKIKDDIVVE